ncbi:Lrp/AsnC family transcriptional regulator [Actinomadura kijaniata]|uniref:DNA-binding Lrp family transcriptional regulator n=1 Tax=Actinomadura namibiensis TaxID=182080 RepID=A0A7W3QPC9_ACTNM|nr:Lrp/AsnC family transcriptional regulator [Actinomadura namibiensis]MBA8954509.1 DNA-binding Lrp family transcriptional regulator [Actinomadura namibiensis]
MESDTLDVLDRRLLHALHLDARAPASRIAEVLDVSGRTITRRLGRLRATGTARVTAMIDQRATGHAEWLVRLRVSPDGMRALVRPLARRSDTTWLTVLSGGTEAVLILRAHRADPAPLRALASSPHVRDVTAHRLLRHLMDHRWHGRTCALTAEQAAALRPPASGGTGPVALNDLDRRILPVLAADARASYPELARHAGWSESAVRRRLDELRRSGTLRFDVEIDSALLGYSVECLLWLTVSPARLATVAQALAADAETAFVGAITGPHNLLAITVCRDEEAFYTYLTGRIGRLDGIEHMETVPVTSYAKRVAPAL